MRPPATVRDFVDQLRREQWRTKRDQQTRETGNPNPPLVISDIGGPNSYEGVLREFFLDTLTTADDQAMIELWLFALELAYAGIEEVDSDRIGKLFGPG